MTDQQPTTRAVRAGLDTDRGFGAVVPPIYLSSTFTFEGYGTPRAHDYTRTSNPTRDALAALLAELEGGAGGVVTPTGMAAITLTLLALTRPGDLVVAPHDCYGGTWRQLDSLAERGHLDVAFADLTDTASATRLIAERSPRLILIETPSNPLLRVTDIAAIAEAGHAAGAIVVADNTFLSPLRQRPLELGCDLVLHSTTKFINGHSDVVGGAVVGADAGMVEELAWWSNVLGLSGAPFDAYLTVRGLRTLEPRLRAHEEATTAVVAALTSHPAVAAVHWPGREDHPGHDVAARQARGFGSMVSFDLAGGEVAVRAFLDGLESFCLAESLGGVESLVAHPATMTHASMTPQAQAAAGIGPGLLRLSIGIEDPGDLARDVTAGCDRALAAR